MFCKLSSTLVSPPKNEIGGSHPSTIVIPSPKFHDVTYNFLPITSCHLANPTWSCSHPPSRYSRTLSAPPQPAKRDTSSASPTARPSRSPPSPPADTGDARAHRTACARRLTNEGTASPGAARRQRSSRRRWRTVATRGGERRCLRWDRGESRCSGGVWPRCGSGAWSSGGGEEVGAAGRKLGWSWTLWV
jgi:hypothetical protein